MITGRRHRAATIGWLLVALLQTTAAQESAIKPSSPAVVAPPTWSRVLKMPDGRTFVTDGGLSIDVKFAQPATLPPTVIPPESAKILAGLMTEPFDRESGLDELRPGAFPNSFATPDDVTLNGNYLTFLRRVLPAGRTRLRTRGKRDPVVIVTDGQAIGVMMPLAPAK